jgi:hypothetical protein
MRSAQRPVSHSGGALGMHRRAASKQVIGTQSQDFLDGLT